MIRII
jgi:hypothetical protein